MALLLPGQQGMLESNTATAIGAGRANTATLLASPDCTVATSDDSVKSAFQKAADHRAWNGLADWFIPSKDELELLCRYPYRNGIGGFPNDENREYVSSSTQLDNSTQYPKTKYWQVSFNDGACTSNLGMNEVNSGTTITNADDRVLTRPIRAF